MHPRLVIYGGAALVLVVWTLTRYLNGWYLPSAIGAAIVPALFWWLATGLACMVVERRKRQRPPSRWEGLR